MRKLFAISLMVTTMVTSLNAAVIKGNGEIVGEWKYETPMAPYGYEAGTIVINEKGGDLTGEVKFKDGNKVKLKNVKFSDGVLNCELYIDYELISVEAEVDGKKLSGTVNTPDGKLEITAEKAS